MKDEDCQCEEVRRRLDELIDAELEDDLCARLQRHVDACPECHEIADVEAHIRRTLRRACSERAPEQLRARVLRITVQRTTYYG
ncbi:mycothiol system anti-sigma-R factor [Bowdeniella nasicola]|uniref:Mycothiol system anti-sigma-R factor n=1 Tax=Bowdeniella nasicola TaxID=208480 RepID=A0A1Q5PZG1_9ACTO|nr:mycothiol system anti-sigma-R factor [Bowdeniella nasicola]OKL52927.1 mycothiol system anti-sigma-R factor [Bowdeniella nasicola]